MTVALSACLPETVARGAGKSVPPTDDTMPMTSQNAAPERIILTGQLVPGVTCPAIRLDDGRTVALSHLDPGFDTGMRVRVTGSGYIGSMSCQQEVLAVLDMTQAD